VCEASKDAYYSSPKMKPLGAEVSKVMLQQDGKSARVVTLVENEYAIPFAQQKSVRKMPAVTFWKLENGQWCYYLEPPAPKPPPGGLIPPSMNGPTPMGGVGVADLPKLVHSVTTSKQQFDIPAGADGKDEMVITNGLNGAVKLVFGCRKIPGLECKSDKEVIGYAQQAKATVEFKFSGTKLPQGLKATLWVEPFHHLMQFPIQTH
jgi:hypothetical protein